MQSCKAFIVAASILLMSVLHQPVRALTFDYNTKAQALVEIVWYGYLGEEAFYDYQTKEANNARSYAEAYFEEPVFSEDIVGTSALAEASVEPNEVVLSAEISGSYEFGTAWEVEFIKSFYQDANSTTKGRLQINEFSTGTPCSLQIDISFPNETWKAPWFWRLYIESSSGYFYAGRDVLGDFGARSGTLDTYAGEEIYVFFNFIGIGYADHDIEDLGDGKFTINATLTATKKIMTKAYNPTPADGSLYNDTTVSLAWWPGDTAISHDVYFGSSFDDVNDGTSKTFQGNQDTTYFIAGSPGSASPDGLIPGTTYYWRIDEVDADGTTKNKGDIWSFRIPPRTAYDPNPADGAEFVDPNTTLSWAPGFEAKLHTVYFGDNFDDVNNVSGGPSQESTIYTPDLLELEKVYYWRVDEYDGVATYKGDVWGFTTPGAAGSLQPANGAINVQMNSTLNWTPATTAVSHDVYFGTDKEAVRNATTASPEYKGNKALSAESYDPGKLAWQSDYYWRVDAIYNMGTVKGLVWSFTTADFITVDDFEDYDLGNNEIWWVWKDGLGYVAHDNEPAYLGNGTGSAVGDETTFSYTEETIVHGGRQSMPLSYDNNKQGYSKYSEVELTLSRLRDLGPRDWTENGVNTLKLWFIGNPGNAAEPLYVAVSNSTGTPAVVVHDDPSAATINTWTEWVIPLQTLAEKGIILTDVDRIAIGLGTKGNMTIPGGSGKMFFDDIRLYRPAEEPQP